MKIEHILILIGVVIIGFLFFLLNRRQTRPTTLRIRSIPIRTTQIRR